MLTKPYSFPRERRSVFVRGAFLKGAAIAAALLSCCLFAAADSRQSSPAPAAPAAGETTLEDYVNSRDYASCIVFDPSSIKQFFGGKSVLNQNESISVFLENKDQNGFESIPLKIRLVNVNASQDCKVEVITESRDADFTVTDGKSKALSKSSSEPPWGQYRVSAASFHLEDVPDHSFSLKFASKTQEEVLIKGIILSFPRNQNSSFLSSPGVLEIKRDDVDAMSATLGAGDVIELKGRRGGILSKRFILVPNGSVETSVRVKNAGDKPTHIYVGFAVYNKDGEMLRGNNYPYKNQNTILTVVSSEAGSNKIVVDSYPEWGKNCYLAINAEEDLFDVPNTVFADGRIVEAKKLDDGKTEITMDKPFKTALKAGTKVRIHGLGGAYLYTGNKILQPGEEEVFTSSIKKDDTFFQYSVQAFSRGVYSVKPLILSHSVDANEENTVVISDYKVSY